MKMKTYYSLFIFIIAYNALWVVEKRLISMFELLIVLLLMSPIIVALVRAFVISDESKVNSNKKAKESRKNRLV